MTKEFKQTLLFSSIYIILYLLIIAILLLLFKYLELSYTAFIAAVVAYIFAPRFKEVEFQSGRRYQVKWIFMKKIFLI